MLKKELALNVSTKSKNKVQWLQKFSFVFLLYWLIDFMGLSWYSLIGAIHQEVFYVTMLCNTIFITAFVFFAVRNNKVFSQILLNNWNGKYRNSALSKDDSKVHLKMIMEFMNHDKPYLDPELSLPLLAEQLEMKPHQISQILNSELGESFYEFLNEFRFEEVKLRLQQSKYKHLTIQAIAMDSGFNNKNTFNKVFKKRTGITPSQFLQSIQN